MEYGANLKAWTGPCRNKLETEYNGAGPADLTIFCAVIQSALNWQGKPQLFQCRVRAMASSVNAASVVPAAATENAAPTP